MCKYLFLAIFLFVCVAAKAQTPDTLTHRNKKDSLNHRKDSLTSKPFVPRVKPKKEIEYHPDSTHSPHTAWTRSAMFPGLGQIYNKKGLYWRLPALYGGLGLLVSKVITFTQLYHAFLAESQLREKGIIDPQFYPYAANQAIYDVKDQYLRNLQLSYFGIVAVWGVNVVDAYVTAKFIHSYTMDNDLSFKVTPEFISQPVYASNFNATFTPALKITLLFK